MIALTRLPEPEILVRKGKEWTAAFVASDKKRPESRRYAHTEIRQALRAMSHRKCFFCESVVRQGNDETVDHFVEVALDRTLAYTWTNLHLCCSGCQATVRVDGEELDPTSGEESDDPSLHIRFDEEVVKPLSARGRASIARRKLDSVELEHARLKAMKQFHRELCAVALEAGQQLDAVRLGRLRALAQPDHRYSAMFRCLLEDSGL